MKKNWIKKGILLLVTATVISWAHNIECMNGLSLKELELAGLFHNSWKRITKQKNPDGTAYSSSCWCRRTGKYLTILAFMNEKGDYVAQSTIGQLTKDECNPEMIFKDLQQLYIKEQEEKGADSFLEK